MCTGIEIALLAASTAVSAAGTISQGRNAARLANCQAALQRRLAERVSPEAAAQAAAIRRRQSRESSRLRARLSASGVDTSSGSPLLSLETISGDGELEALTAINQGAFRAESLEGDAQSSLLRGRAARQDSYFRTGSTLLTAARKVDFDTGKIRQ